MTATMALSAHADDRPNGPDTEPPAPLESRELTIAPSDLSQALLALGQQARISIVFPKDVTEAVQSAGVDGAFTVTEALDRLIGEACLGYSVVSERLIAVHASCEAPRAATTAEMSAQPYPPADHPAVAAGIGVAVTRARTVLLCATALLTAALVSAAGAIGFVGLVLPHAARALVGPGHARLLPVSALAGAVFLVWADTLARTVLAPQEVPVGVVTSLVGVPAFVLVLYRTRGTR